MKNRVLMIGIDGATWRVLGPMIEEGRLPNIHKLVSSGASGILHSTIPPLTPSAFASFHTGVNPGKHGIIDFRLYQPETGENRLVSSVFLVHRSFLEIASDMGKDVISINVPLTYPPPRLRRGVVISGFLAPKVYPGFVYPEEVFYNILKDTNYRILGQSLKQKMHQPVERIMENFIEVESVRYKVARMLMDKHDWDLVIVHNQSLDAVQHGYFHFLDRESPLFSEEMYDKVARFYESMDREIGRLVENTDDSTTVILFSDHGFKLIKKTVSLNTFLYKKGYIKMLPRKRRILKLGKMKRFIEGIDSHGVRYKIYDLLGIDLRMRRNLIARYTSRHEVYERLPVYMRNGCHFGNLFFNDKLIEGKDFVEEVIDSLTGLKDPETGERVINRLYMRDEVFHGSFLESMPYLFVEPAGDFSFTPGLFRGSVFMDVDHKHENTGGHAIDGIITIWGKNVRPIQGVKCSIMDIAPTVLALLGTEIPDYMDGRVLEEVFYKPPEVKKVEYSGERGVGGEGLSRDDEALVRERLEDLGYM
jgi:predicted AlkP superfamily phosphohydrolase/phosphomutase